MSDVLKKKVFFLILFSITGFITLQVPFNKLAGSNVSFTLFDFFAPIAGAFLGPFYGIASVFAVEVLNNFVKQTPWTSGVIIRLFPILFATYYFASVSEQKRREASHFTTINNRKYNAKWVLAVPILCILIFLTHPIGRQVFYYPLMFWLIPLIAYKFRANLYLKSLGATFTAHSVGGAAWIWAFNLKASVWNGLIPLVIAERLLFAMGISVSFILVKKILTLLISKKILPQLDTSVV